MVESGVVVLFGTRISFEETKSRIFKRVATIKDAAKEAVRDGRGHSLHIAALADKRFYCLLDSPDLEALAGHIWGNLRNYLEGVNIQIVEIDNVNPSEVFAGYFQHAPPFAKDRQKQPFPDVFSVAALKGWCEASNEKMYVVSNDSDIQHACERVDDLVHVHSLREIIVQGERSLERYPEAVQSLLEQNPEKLAASIEEAFRDIPIYLEDVDGDVTVDTVDVQLGTVDVVQDQDTPGQFMAYVWADVSFDAEAEFADPEKQVWDSDDGELLTFGYRSETLSEAQGFEVTAIIECSSSNGILTGYIVRELGIGAIESIFLRVDEITDPY